MWQSPIRTSTSSSTTAIPKVCEFALKTFCVYKLKLTALFLLPVFFNALLAMLNAREKLSRFDINESVPDSHVYHPPTSSRRANSGPWNKIAGAIRFPGMLALKDEKRASGDGMEHSRKWELAMFNTVRTGSKSTEDAYQTTPTETKRKEQVSNNVILPVLLYRYIVLTKKTLPTSFDWYHRVPTQSR